MEVEGDDLPEIADVEEKVVKRPSKPELESSPRAKTEEEKENETKTVPAVRSSWLVFSGATNLFADDEDDDKKSSASSISLPKMAASGENEDDDVLQLDDSSFLDEHEALKTQEQPGSSSTSPNVVIDTVASSKKAKKRSKKKSGGSDDETPLKSLKKKKKSKSEKKNKPDEGEEGDLPDLDKEGDVPMFDEDEGDSPGAGEIKKSKRLSKKELEKMHADAQRVLREAPVTIPVRRAEPLNLDDILQEVASINSEVRKFIEKDDKKKKPEDEKPERPAQAESGDVIVIGDDPTAELSNKAEKADDSDIELEIVDELVEPPAPKKIPQTEVKPVNPGVAWLMQRFKRHSLPGKAHQDDQAAVPPTSWNVVKGHLQEEMVALREKGLQERIQRYKMENEEELGEPEPEEEEAEMEPGDNSSDDDSYTTISDDDQPEEKKVKRKRRNEQKQKGENPLASALLDKEAMETGSEDEDYQPSEGHRDDGGLSTDEGSISSGDEKVKSGSDSDSEGSDDMDSDEIDSENDEEMETSDEEEEILRSTSKKKKRTKKPHVKKAFDSDDEDEKGGNDNDDLPELIVEERPPAIEESEEPNKEQEENDVQAKVDAILEPSVTSVSSIVMPPDMPRPKELFNIYNDPFDIVLKGTNNDENGGEAADNNLDDLLGLCTGPFLPVETNKTDETEEDVEETEIEAPVTVRKLKHVYGSKSKASTLKEPEISDDEGDSVSPVEETAESKKAKKERRKRLREFIEDEAELSSDEEAGRVSADEDEGSSSDDSYETDPEFEDEALAKLTNAQLQKQVESIHMRQVIDEDERDLLHLREAIIPDADLADAVGPRLKRFRWAEAWRDMGGTDLASQGENVHADDDYLGLAALDVAGPGSTVASLSSVWQKQRVERERWLQNQQAQQTVGDSQATVLLSAENETLNEKSSGSDCQLVRLGLSAMRKSSGSNASFSTTAASTSILTAAEPSSSSCSAVPRRVSHGSMLSWLQQKELDKIAQTVGGASSSSNSHQNAATSAKRRSGAMVASHSAGGADPKPEEMMATSGYKSRTSSGPFIVMNDEKSSPGERKRKFDTGDAFGGSKRGKTQQPSSSVFDFLS